jgi:hypothetical protein
MSLGKIKLYPASLFVSLLVLYLIATDSHGWYIYILIGFIMVERALVAFVIWMLAKAQLAMVQKIMEQMGKPPEGGIKL